MGCESILEEEAREMAVYLHYSEMALYLHYCTLIVHIVGGSPKSESSANNKLKCTPFIYHLYGLDPI